MLEYIDWQTCSSRSPAFSVISRGFHSRTFYGMTSSNFLFVVGAKFTLLSPVFSLVTSVCTLDRMDSFMLPVDISDAVNIDTPQGLWPLHIACEFLYSKVFPLSENSIFVGYDIYIYICICIDTSAISAAKAPGELKILLIVFNAKNKQTEYQHVTLGLVDTR